MRRTERPKGPGVGALALAAGTGLALRLGAVGQAEAEAWLGGLLAFVAAGLAVHLHGGAPLAGAAPAIALPAPAAAGMGIGGLPGAARSLMALLSAPLVAIGLLHLFFNRRRMYELVTAGLVFGVIGGAWSLASLHQVVAQLARLVGAP